MPRMVQTFTVVQIGSVLIKQGIRKFLSTSVVYLNNTCLMAHSTANPDVDITSVIREKQVKKSWQKALHKDVV